MERVVFVASSFEEADKEDAQRYQAMTPGERLEIVEALRRRQHPTIPRLERVFRVAELGES